MTCEGIPAPRSHLVTLGTSVRAWLTAAPADVHRTAAISALVDDPKAANDRQAVAHLAHAVWAATPQLVARILLELDAAGQANGQPTDRDGMLVLDACLADWMADLAPHRATVLRDRARERLSESRRGNGEADLLKLWRDSAVGALSAVARTLWLARVRDAWEQGRHVRPALVHGVAFDLLTPAMTGRARVSVDGVVEDQTGRVLGRVPSIELDALQLMREALPLFGSVAAHRFVRYVVVTAHDQWQCGVADPRTIEFVGGFRALANAIGDRTKDHDRLVAVLRAGQCIHWEHPAMQVGGLWTWTHRRGGPGHPGLLRVQIGDALMPTLAARLADGGGNSPLARRARALVPELRADPPLSAVRDRDQGAVWLLHRLFVVELVNNAPTLCRENGLLIHADRWRELARLARLPIAELLGVLDSWRSGDDLAPPLVLEVEAGRFTLADPHAAERAFILESGRRRLDGAAHGRKGRQTKMRGGPG